MKEILQSNTWEWMYWNTEEARSEFKESFRDTLRADLISIIPRNCRGYEHALHTLEAYLAFRKKAVQTKARHRLRFCLALDALCPTCQNKIVTWRNVTLSTVLANGQKLPIEMWDLENEEDHKQDLEFIVEFACDACRGKVEEVIGGQNE